MTREPEWSRSKAIFWPTDPGTSSPPNVRDDSPLALLVVLTSLARTSDGGHSFARGLTAFLARAPNIRLTLVLPDMLNLQPETDFAHHVNIIWVRPLVGPMRVIRDVIRLRRWANDAHPSLIILPHEWAAPAGNVPLVNVVQNILHLHGVGRRQHPLKALLMRQAAKRTAKFAKNTIAVSDIAADIWYRQTGSAPIVLPEGVDPLFCLPKECSRTDLLVMMTGEAEYKNPELALEAIRCARGLGMRSRIVVIGLDGQPPPILDIEVIHHLPPADLAALFRLARVVVMSSTLESFGLPAFEAAASGATVVVADDTSMAQWLGSYPSVITAAPNATAFAQAMITAMRINDSSRRQIDNLDWDQVGVQWLDTFRQIVG